MQLLLYILTLIHAFHLSKTEINYDVDSNSIQIASKVFIDDLEDELKLDGFTRLNIGTGKEKTNVDSILQAYFIKNLVLKSGENVIKAEFLGKEISEDLIAVWVYIEAPLNNKLTELKIKNTILTKLFDDQQNMMIIKKNNKMLNHKILDVKNKEFKTSF